MHDIKTRQGDSAEPHPQAASADDEGSALGVSPAPILVKGKKKKRLDAETIAQLIAHVCNKKGNPPKLSAKLQQRLASGPRLDEDSIAELLLLARDDEEFAVPRNLVLASREIIGYPALRGQLRDFARRCLLQHRLFQSAELIAAIHNTPEGPSIFEAFTTLMKLPEQPKGEKQTAKKGREKENRRRRFRAAYVLAVWFAENRGISLATLSDALYQSLWAPAAAGVRDGGARLNALTRSEDVLALGLACGEFHAQAAEAGRRIQAAEEILALARTEADALRLETETLSHEVELLKTTVLEVREQQSEVIKTHLAELAHLRAAMEGQRTRVLRRLKEDQSLLEEALIALRRDPPKVRVMEDHAERVIESQRGEIKSLESER